MATSATASARGAESFGSLPPDVVRFRLDQALRLADLPGEMLIQEVLPTLFSPTAAEEQVERFAAGMRSFHPAGLRATARAFARADLREVLPTIEVPTLLIYGTEDMRAPRDVAEGMHAAIRGSMLVMIDGAGSRSERRCTGSLRARGPLVLAIRGSRSLR